MIKRPLSFARGRTAGLLLAGAAIVAAAPGDDEALRRLLRDNPLPDPPRLELQRPVDVRLAAIEARGIEGSSLFTGARHVARNAREVAALSGRLAPGDQLVLTGTDWADARFTFQGRGTERAPILIRGERPGAVVFTGQSAAIFHGAHLVVMDLVFADVQVPATGGVIFRLGNGADLPAENCLVNRIEIRDCNSPRPQDWPVVRMFYLLERGRDNTIANSVFSGMRHFGQMIAAQNLPAEGLQRLHLLRNRFADRPKIDDQNGYEIIQIGWSGESARPAGSLIEGNTFERCNGEAEIVTVKASDVVVRGNRFVACEGMLTLRTSDRAVVQANVFDGRALPNTGGVRIAGAGHVIAGNVFRDLRAPRDYFYWAVSLMAASGETTADDVAGYGRAKNILIAENRFERTDARIAAGVYPRPEYPLLPTGVRVRNNAFFGATGASTSALDYLPPGLPADAVEERGTILSERAPATARLANLSVRAPVAPDRQLIAGFAVQGGPWPILARAVGPGLAPFLAGGAADPRIELFDHEARPVAANEDWGGGAELAALFARTGAFALPPASRDAALVRTVAGAHTLHCTAPAEGVALLEIYEAEGGPTPRLVNFSVRHAAGIVAGFVVAGDGEKTVLVRAIGPTLASGFGVAGAVARPTLELFDGDGRSVARGEGWPATLASLAARAGAFALPAGSGDAALLLTLPPGAYSAHAADAAGGAGEVLVEIYEVP